MLKPLNKETASAAIAEDLALPIVLLSSPDPQVRLAMLDKIGAALLRTNLTFRDLAERVVAPRTTTVEPVTAIPPVPSTASFRPTTNIQVDPAKVLSDDELAFRGYRTGSGGSHGGFGYRETSDTFETIPGETNAEAGHRLAKWALTTTGQPFYENPATGELHPPKWVIPGVGKVRLDGTLGPLPTKE